MGNYVNLMVVAPAVTRDDVERLATRAREVMRYSATVIVCDLSGKRVRKERLVKARDAGLRILDLDVARDVDRRALHELAVELLDKDSFLWREADDEDLDVCEPPANWLRSTFGVSGLDWILHGEHDPVPWNREKFFVFPGNPPEVPVTLPLQASFFVAAFPGDERPCPMCRRLNRSKFLRSHCPECGYVFESFSSAEAAMFFEEVRIDAHCWGNCERCQGAYQFAARFEQCMRCGQLLRVGWTHPKASVRDNEHEFRRALASVEVWRSESLR